MTPLTYRKSGVDTVKADRLVKRIAAMTARDHATCDELLAGLGGFAALYELPLARYKQPVIVSGTDGVGTKLKLAIQCKQHQGIGIDLVAMCVNDVITCGADPAFFLDYYACGALDLAQSEIIIKSIYNGCKIAQCALIGGETAELPGLYQQGDYDLAGFCVGLVDKPNIISGEQIQAGDIILGLGSSGAHANGYSLIRAILEQAQSDLQQPFGNSTLAEVLLAPTRIYAASLAQLGTVCRPKGIAHITGGGIAGNLIRILPPQCAAQISPATWQIPVLFQWLQQTGAISTEEMFATFNMGVGMIVIVSAADKVAATDCLRANGEVVFEIGAIKASADEAVVELLG